MAKISVRYLWLLALILVAMTVAACDMRQKGRKPSNDWSRGVPVGVFVRGDVDMVVVPDGTLHFVFMVDDEGTLRAQYVQLDETAVPISENILDISGDQIRSPRIAQANNDTLHFLWSSRRDSQPEWDLWYAQLGPDGALNDAVQLADVDQDVGDYLLQVDSQGRAYVVWENGADQTIIGMQMDVGGSATAVATPLVSQGNTPSLYVDAQDDLHFIWRDGITTRYASWPQGDWRVADGEALVNIPLVTGQTLDGPVVGVAGDSVTVVWSIFSSSGLQAGSAIAEYISFPVDEPQISTPQQMLIAAAEEQPYEPYSGAYQLTQLSPPVPVTASSDFVRQPTVAQAQGNELAVGLSVNQDFRLGSFIQTGVALFEAGEFIGYQPAGKTEAFSQKPVLQSDAEGNLYMAWREGGRGRLIFFSLTAPTGRTNLDRFAANDVANVALNGGIEAIAGALFFPVACVWFFPGFLIIGLWHWRRGDSEFREPATVVFLIIAIIVSQVMKFLFLPTITTYVPFSAWLDIGAQWQRLLMIIVPIFTISTGLLVAWLMHRRTPSAIAFFLWFTIVDGLLTLAIYGVNLMGVF